MIAAGYREFLAGSLAAFERVQDVRVIHAISARGTRCACPVASPPALTRPWANSPDPSWLAPAAGARVIRPYRRSITRQRWRIPSPLRHHPMPKRAAVRSQIRRASKLPRYPHGHVMETMSSRPTVYRLDAASVQALDYSQASIRNPSTRRFRPSSARVIYCRWSRDQTDVFLLFQHLSCVRRQVF